MELKDLLADIKGSIETLTINEKVTVIVAQLIATTCHIILANGNHWPDKEYRWISAFDRENRQLMRTELMDCYSRCQSDGKWEELDALMHEWEESGWAALSPEISEAMQIVPPSSDEPFAKFDPITVPGQPSSGLLIQDRDRIPTFDAYLTVSGEQSTLFCPNCLFWHFHGAIRPGAETHKAAHCPSVFGHMRTPGNMPKVRDTGYILRMIGPISDDIVKQHNIRRGYAWTRPKTERSKH